MGAPRSPKNTILAAAGRRLSIQRCIQSLVHACQCRNTNCSLLSCRKMKRVVQHTKACKRTANGGCPWCKQLIALCCYHAKRCQETICPVPFCYFIKHKLRQRQRRLVQLHLPPRPTSTAPVTPNSEQQPSTPQTPQPMPNQPQHQQGMPRRMPDNIDPNAFQDLQRILKSPYFPQQKQQVDTILKSNPPMMVSFKKFMKAKNQASQPQAQQRQSPQAMMGAPPGTKPMVAMQSGQLPRPGMPPQQQQPQQAGPQGMLPMGPQGQKINAAHNGNPQLCHRQLLRIIRMQQIQLNRQQAAMPQGHGQLPQQQPGPASYSQLPMQQQVAMQGGEGPMGQIPPMAQGGQSGPSNSPGSNSSSRC